MKVTPTNYDNLERARTTILPDGKTETPLKAVLKEVQGSWYIVWRRSAINEGE